jgi:hypothetical protein
MTVEPARPPATLAARCPSERSINSPMPQITEIPSPYMSNGSRVPAGQQPSQEGLLSTMHELLLIHGGTSA